MAKRPPNFFVNGVTVVLCAHSDELEGAAIAWATKVEKDHLMLSLPREAALTDALLARNVFTVSVLAYDQSAVARQYGGSKQRAPLPKSTEDLELDLWEVPVIKSSRAQYLCKLVHDLPVKEQIVVIASILETNGDESRKPLNYDRRSYFD